MNYSLTDDQKAFCESAKAFSNAILAPNAAKWDSEHIFPKDALAAAGELGFMGMYTPEAAGGMELGRLDTSIIMEQLAKGCTSTTAYISIHNMATNMVGKYGRSSLIAEWCPELIAGTKLSSYCLTEAGSGSDAASLQTTAKTDGNNYIINGSKSFISGAGETDLLIVMVRTGKSGAGGISSIAIPSNTEGISFGKPEKKMGWNSQPTRSINFDDVKVHKDNLLGKEGQGFKIAMEGLDGGRLGIASCSLGTAQIALDQTIEYVKERNQFGKAIADFQHTQFKLADMATELVAARQMIRLAAYKLDQGDADGSTFSAMAKKFVTDTCFNIVNQALQLHGGYGYIKDYPLERYVRDLRVHQILEGTNEIMRLIIARRLLNNDITFGVE